MQRPRLASHVYKLVPATTALTNPGAAVGAVGLKGAWFRGGAIQIPPRLVHVGTLWGLGAVQEEVVAVGGKVEVRPVLPVLFVFDHRLIDGVKATRLITRFVALLQDPVAAFGPLGEAA